MIEQSICGVVTMITNCHATLNNHLVGNYNPNKGYGIYNLSRCQQFIWLGDDSALHCRGFQMDL